MTNPSSIVVLGAGPAGGAVALGLRTLGYEGAVTLIGAEPHPPYERPPLSKGVLVGNVPPERCWVRKPGTWSERGIELRTGIAGTGIDATADRVRLANGDELAFGALVLATGVRPRRPYITGAGLPGVFVLRTLDDTRALRQALRPGAHILIAGGGYLGLEIAASVRRHGARATIVEIGPQVLGRSVGEITANFFATIHREAGVEIVFGRQVAAIEGDAGVQAVTLDDGRRIEADAVVFAIGAIANDEVAQQAGLDCDDGVLVDGAGRSSRRNVWALGDVARIAGADGTRHRFESVWATAYQARTVAAAILGRPAPAAEVPWFWSDQYDVKLQIVGMRQRGDRALVQGSITQRKFLVWYIRDGAVAAVDLINRSGDFQRAKQAVAARLQPEQLGLDLAVETAT